MTHSQYTPTSFVPTQTNGRGCECPECGEPQGPPPVITPCTCPTMMYIPPGYHIHVTCPRHGRVRINGSSLTF